jgi:pimeloyl-ACP methyl ester carboxylesterase
MAFANMLANAISHSANLQEIGSVTTQTATNRQPTATRFLHRPEGRIGYEVTGDGPLVVCVPGMGDLRSVYRFLTPALVEAGYRVAAMDLRGHGDSDATFSSYDDVAAGTDVLALVHELGGGPAVLIGNSMGAGAAAWAAAEGPDVVAALVLVGPFVRNVPVGRAMELAFRLALMKPWGPAAWNAWYGRLYPGRAPDDLAEHRARIRESLRRSGRWAAFIATTRTDHSPVEQRLDEVQAPTLVVMGEQDPDFPDARAEADLVAARLGGRTLVVPEAGHYPQAEYPDIVAPAILGFLAEVA